MHDIVDWFLRERGITTEAEKELFVRPDYERDTHSPFLMHDMLKAVERISVAVQKNERIAVYADFDADGIPGAVVLHDMFKKIGYENTEVYIPHRDKEGFGFHADAVTALAGRGIKLIITVDVGITGTATVEHARALGIDVIITDHHVPDAVLPDAYAILNPKKNECEYPFKELCGAGVAFKLVCGFLEYVRSNPDSVPGVSVPHKGWEKWLLDMVGIATIADMVPLVGENRTLARFGLVVLRKTRRPGLVALMRVTRIRQRYASEDDIGFFIAPRINAASRMDSPDIAFTMLATRDVAIAEDSVRLLEQLNRKRKTAVAGITKEAQARAKTDLPIIVLGNPDWKPAFLGLAAQSLSQMHNKTVCLWGCEGNGTFKGSCRTVGDVSLPKLFEAVGTTLDQYGGHDAAGGFSFDEKMVHNVRNAFSSAYTATATTSTQEQEAPRYYSTTLSAVSPQVLGIFDTYAPFGLGNEKPLFCVRARVASVRRFGKGDVHIECSLVDNVGSARAVAFFYDGEAPEKDTERTFVGTCDRDTFRGGVVFRIQHIV